MKNKIICAFLCAVMLFSLFSVFAFAVDVNPVGPSTLEEEIQVNFPDLELEKIVKHGESTFLGVIVTDLTSWPKLCVYMYLPEYIGKEDVPKKGTLSLDVHTYNSSDELHTYIEKTDKTMYLEAFDKGFAKYTFSFSSDAFFAYSDYVDIVIDRIEISNNCYTLDIHYSIDYKDDGTCDIKYEVNELVCLQVYSTDYRTKSTDTKYDYDNIVSLYFSIPQKYQDWYDYLYSVTCQMLKRRTKPIFVSNIKDIGIGEDAINTPYYVQKINQLLVQYLILSGKNATTNAMGAGVIITEKYYAYPGWEDGQINTDVETEKLSPFAMAFCDPDAKSFYDIDINGDALKKFIDAYGENVDLFIDKEYNKYVTKTINDKWDSLDYSYSADFFDFWRDFGFFEAFKYLWLKDDETKLYEYFEKHGINPDGYNFKDEPFLVKVDEAVLGDLSELESEAFCDKYAIGYDDYEHFKKFAQENENVVIYRIDVDSYYSTPGKVFEKTGTGYYSTSEKYPNEAMGIVQTCVYEDVEVIDITMSRNGEYHSLKTSSNIVNIYPDLEGIKPESGMPSNGDFWKGMGGFFVNVLTGYDPNDADDKPSWLQTLLLIINIVLIVIAIIVVIYIITLIVKLVNQARMGRYLRQQNKKNE